MTDSHCHVTCGDPSVREFLIGRDFLGVHPWDVSDPFCDDVMASLPARLEADSRVGVGEIGLDRLRDRNISPRMRDVFLRQLDIAAAFARPVVLHGAKCWGEVVHACLPHCGRIPAFLFHGFSRSDGLLPDIVKLNGFISVGPAVLNDHAVNYRALVKRIPLDRLLVETDRTDANAAECPPVGQIAAKLAELRGVSVEEIVTLADTNASRFAII